MARSTVEQFRKFRHRCLGTFFIEVCTLIVAPVVAVAVIVLLGESNFTKVISVISFLLVFITGQLIRHIYFRCPVCGHALPRGARHVRLKDLFNGHCNHCGTDFIP
jgi:hypothetical protein